MSNPSYTDIQYDVGDARNVTDGSTAIKSFITKAQSKVKLVTGTTTGDAQDLAIRNLAAAYTVNAMLGGLGPETVNDKNIVVQRDEFINEANKSLLAIGKSLDGFKIQFKQINP